MIIAAPYAAAPAAATDLTAAIARIKKSIVGIATCQLTRRPPVRLRGTGFAVADGRHVVTNFHVINVELSKPNREFLCLVYGRGRNPRFEEVKVEATDEEHDTALLSFDGKPFTPVIFGDDQRAPDGLPIAFTGYPIGIVLGFYPVTHRGIVAAHTPIAIPQLNQQTLNARMVKQLRNVFDVLQLDATAYPGNSGSPLYDQRTGRVLGIVSSVYVKGYKENALTNPSGITYAIPIRHARKLIRRLGIPVNGQASRSAP